MYAFYNKKENKFMMVNVNLSQIPFSGDTGIFYTFSETGDILYTERKETLEFILRKFKQDDCGAGSYYCPYGISNLAEYEIVKLVADIPIYKIYYCISTGYNTERRSYKGNINECYEYFNNSIREHFDNGQLKDIEITFDGKVVKKGVLDVLEFFVQETMK